MTETEARRVLLLRAFEQPSPAAPWTVTDADAATREARHRLGEHAAAAPFVAERARLATEQLACREPAVDASLAATGPHDGLRRAAVVLAALAGVLSDAVGPVGALQRINILALPLFGLLVWNLAVYAALAVAACGAAGRRHRHRPTDDASASRGDPTQPTVIDGPLRRALGRLLRTALRRSAGVASAADSPAAAPIARFLTDWWRSGAALNGARLAGTLHAGAAAFALAAIASLYVRGLGFEFRAGWDSTFLTAGSVHRLLSLLFAPALAITGITLPDVDALARLRFAAGHGENAARWIHLQALTIGLFVVLPRGLLAARAGWRAGRLENDFTLPLDDLYFARLVAGGRVTAVSVLPYSYQPPAGTAPTWTAALERLFGGTVQLRLAPAVPLGGEDDPAGWSAALHGAPAVALLFASTATPERETHGAFVAAVAGRLPPTSRLHVLVDESAFRRRFGGADAASRIEPRRAAWRRMLAACGGPAPVFVDASAP